MQRTAQQQRSWQGAGLLRPIRALPDIKAALAAAASMEDYYGR